MTPADRPNELTRSTGHPPEAPIVVCVLGMHRSGTSALIGCLEEAGLFLGDVNRSHPHNLKGNRENREIRELNEDVLSFSNGSWIDPPKALSWDHALAERRDALIATFASQQRVWGFKDPRTILTLPFWREALPNLQRVATFRHPMAVARSLFNRGGRPIQQSLRLWRHYNAIILDEIRKAPFPCVCFDLPADVYAKRVDAIASQLLQNSRAVSGGFFSAELRHVEATAADGDLDPEIRAIYTALCEVSSRVERDATSA